MAIVGSWDLLTSIVQKRTYHKPRDDYPAELPLANNTAARLRVLWVDRPGITNDYGFLEPYSRRILQSYASQTWLAENPISSFKLLLEIKDSESELVIDGPLLDNKRRPRTREKHFTEHVSQMVIHLQARTELRS